MVLKKNDLLGVVKANVNVLRDWVILRCRGEKNIETERDWKDIREISRREVSN